MAKARRRGRPALDEKPEQVTLNLLRSQRVYLDRIAIDMLDKYGISTNRAELVRVLIEAVRASGVDLTELTASHEGFSTERKEKALSKLKDKLSKKLS